MRFLLPFLFVILVATASAQEVRRAEPVYDMTQAEYNATVLHKAALVDQRNAELQKALDDANAATAANAKTIAIVPDLKKQIASMESDIGALKRKDFLDRWKFSIVGLFVGIIVAIGSFFAVKAGWAGAQASVKLAAIAAKA